MARQSLKGDPIEDATTYLRESATALGEEYERLEEEAQNIYAQWESRQARLSQLQAGHERLAAALRLLEGHPPGNGQDTAPVTSTASYHWEVQEVNEASELLSATEPSAAPVEEVSVEEVSVEDLEPPPQAA